MAHLRLDKLEQLRALTVARLERARAEAETRAERYQADPVAWAADRLGAHLWSKQREITDSVLATKRTVVQSAHATGKSFLASALACWWIDTHPLGDALIVTTAPSYRQIHDVMWEEIRKHHANADLPGVAHLSDRWTADDGRQLGIGRRPADYNQSSFQGLHRKYVLVILDEAGGIPAWLWDAAEAITTGAHDRILAVGNPTDSSSTFARICQGAPLWNTIKVSAFDSPNLTGEPVPDLLRTSLVTSTYVEDAKVQWGETSTLYRVRVLGEFADAEDGLIPLSWVLAANERWHEWNNSPTRDTVEPPGIRVFGVDVALGGEDLTCIAARQGDVVMSVETWAQLDTIAIANLVETRLARHPMYLGRIDSIGVGAGVYDLLRYRKRNVVAFVASHATGRRDSSQQQRFPNLRSASWWNLRELLDPSAGATLALPPDDELTADLTTPRWEAVTGGKIVVEGKDSMRTRIGRSTDRGDAVVMACWNEHPTRDVDAPRASRPIQYANSVQW